MSANKPPPLVAHVIYALGTGGLENGLVNIINRAPSGRYRHIIICLTRAEGFESRIIAPDVGIISLNKQPGHDFGIYWRLWRILLKLRPSIVHTRNLAALEMQLVAALVPGVKRVHGEHGRDVHDIDGSNKKYNYLRKALRPLIHQYIAVSEDLADWLVQVVKAPAGKVKQIYNGVDQTNFHPGSTTVAPPDRFLSDNALVIGTIGRLAEVKNQASLIDAFSRLVESQPLVKDQLRLLIVGDGPFRQALGKQVIELGLSERVWMAGERRDIPELLRMMHLFVLPSLGEGISNTLLEAMATGLPLIATDVGGNPEIIDDGVNGLLVPVDDPQALANALGTLLKSSKLRAEYGANSLLKVKTRFDWNKTVAAYLAVYDQVLGIVPPLQAGAKSVITGSR